MLCLDAIWLYIYYDIIYVYKQLNSMSRAVYNQSILGLTIYL